MQSRVLAGRMAIVAAALCAAVFADRAQAGGSLRTFGACCLPQRACNDGVLEATCDSQGGAFQGIDSQCTAPEACCLPDGTCRDVDPLCCQAKACLGGFNADNICLVDADCEDGANNGICDPLLVGSPRGVGSLCGVQCCADADCDDSAECTEDICDASDPNADPVTGCVNDPLPFSTPCEVDGDLCTNDHCDGTGQCVFNDDVVCDPDNDCLLFVCNPATGQCDPHPINEGLPCDGPPVGDCDRQDFCVEGTCSDIVEPAGTVCRTLTGDCDVEDLCDGSSKECVDVVKPSTETCRPSVGVCDIAEACLGDSPDCPPDGFEPSDVVCREEVPGSLCDAAEFCTGDSQDCPADGFKPDGALCRAATGDCDVEEACLGDSPVCPSDGFASPGTICREADGECDRQEACTGADPDCPPDECKPAGASCSDDGDECTDDSCDGACACIHTNNNRCGACCLLDRSCIVGVTRETCEARGGEFNGAGKPCLGDTDGDGVDDLCDICPGVNDDVFGFTVCAGSADECETDEDCPFPVRCIPACQTPRGGTRIPTVSEWGVVILALLLLVAGKVYFGINRSRTA